MAIDKTNAELGAETIGAFFNQFGSPSDPLVGIFLEVLLEELFDAKIVSILRGTQQAGHQVVGNPPGRTDDPISGNRPETTEPAIRLGEANPEAH